MDSGSEFERKAVEIFAVAAQTSDLSVQQSTGQPLEIMVQPLIFEYKQAGTAISNYLEAHLVDRVSDVSTPGQQITDWEFRAGVIYFTPASIAMDIRIRGDFLFYPLASDSDAITATKNFGHMLAYGVSALVGIVRGNAAWQTAYTVLQDGAFDDVAGYLARKDQAKIRRIGRMTRPRQRSIFTQQR